MSSVKEIQSGITGWKYRVKIQGENSGRHVGLSITFV